MDENGWGGALDEWTIQKRMKRLKMNGRSFYTHRVVSLPYSVHLLFTKKSMSKVIQKSISEVLKGMSPKY